MAFLLLMFVNFFTLSTGAEYASSLGTSFRLAQLPNTPDPTQPGVDRVLITAPLASATGTVSAPGIGWSATFQVSQYGAQLVALPRALRLVTGSEAKAIYVKSSTDVSVYLFSAEVFSGEGTLVYPEDVLETRTYVMSYTPYFFPSSIAIVAPETQAATIEVQTKSSGVWSRHILKQLSAGQTYFANTTAADYTGFRVDSSVPVAVFSGGECLEVPGPPTSGAPLRFYKSGYCDLLLEQMLPPAFWGTSYVTYTNPTRPSSHKDVYRALCASDCELTLTSGSQFNITEGSYVEFEINSRQEEVITCSKNCLVAMYNKRSLSLHPSYDTDPFMTTLIPNTQWGSEYVVYPVGDYQNTTYTTSYVTLVATTTNSIEIMLNGVTRLTANWRVVSGSSYSVLDLPLNPNTPVRFHHPNTNARFALYVSGQSQYDSYGYAAGFKSSTPITTDTEQMTASSAGVVVPIVVVIIVLAVVAVLLWYFLKFKKKVTAYEDPTKIAPERVLSQASLNSGDSEMAKEKAKLFVLDPYSFMRKPVSHKEIAFVRPRSAAKPVPMAWFPD